MLKGGLRFLILVRMAAQSIFINSVGRLRSGWRFTIFLVAAVIAMAIRTAVTEFFFVIFGSLNGRPLTVFFAALSAMSLVMVLLLSWAAVRLMEDLPFRSLGAWFSGSWLRHLAMGIIVGAITLALAVLAAMTLGGLSFEFRAFSGPEIAASLVISLLVFAAAAAFEESLFRGYLLQTLARSGFAWIGVLFPSILFALAHVSNPSATIFSTANTFIAGVWFGLAYLKTRDLWFVFGIHFIWNWLQGSVFGIEVSGMTTLVGATLLKEIDKGPAWLTGDTYGIEGGAACTIALLISIVAIWLIPFVRPSEEMLALTSRENPKPDVLIENEI